MSSFNVFCTITAKNGERVPMELSSTATATELRAVVSKTTRIPLAQLRLIFRGKMIKDDSTEASDQQQPPAAPKKKKMKNAIETYKLEPDCVLHCMGKPAAAPAPAAAADDVAADAVVVAVTPAVAAAVSSVTAAVPTVPTDASTTITSTGAAPSADPVPAALQALRSSNAPPVYSTAVTTLAKILGNIADHPMEDKYRRVKQSNAAFQKRLGGVPGGDAAMRSVGFVVETSQEDSQVYYQLHASADAWPKLMATKATIEAAAMEAQRLGVATTTTTTAAGGVGGGFGGLPGGFGGAGGMPTNAAAAAAMNDPRMQGAMAEMMNNPEALRTMLQNPMLQQMIQNDPNVPPMMRNQMQQLANNPAMLDQLSTMMQDPAMRQRMQGMMAAQGGGGMPGMGGMGGMPGMGGGMPGMGDGMPAAPGAPGNGNNMAPQAPPPAGNDQSRTEDEMIAEAIRRSLEEG